jgi:hypothetical protein
VPTKSKEDNISFIYSQRNDSPKYFELKKSKLLLYAVGLPTITIIALILGGIGLVHTSPFHLIDNYKQNAKARDAIAKLKSVESSLKKLEEEKAELTQKLAALQESPAASATNEPSEKTPSANQPKQISTASDTKSSSTSLSHLMIFKSINGQKDLSMPASLNLSDIRVITNRDTINFTFNIIPAVEGDKKIAGHIIVMMKNESGIQFYPQQVLATPDAQINYLSGESFATQRFRPVDASFLKPRRSGLSTFSIFIFSKNGDLVHYQTVSLNVKI